MFKKIQRFIKYKIINRLKNKLSEFRSINSIKKCGFVRCDKCTVFSELNNYYTTYQHIDKETIVSAIISKDKPMSYPDCSYKSWHGLILNITKPIYFIRRAK